MHIKQYGEKSVHYIYSFRSYKLEFLAHFQPRQRLHLCNDVQTQPGPSISNSVSSSNGDAKPRRRVRDPCAVCGRGVTAASKAVSCDDCNVWTHLRCTGGQISSELYAHYVSSKTNFSFLCNSCSLSSLPFYPSLHGDHSNGSNGAESDVDQEDVFLP